MTFRYRQIPLVIRGPGDIETYRQIVEVLATADPARYQPASPENPLEQLVDVGGRCDAARRGRQRLE
ncbi:hypothetical protein [Micromonospora sp. NBC_00421]|uniref:hypothetical protein n=1 Tax=Micromonospora sp. NBC_00421 TaxID=2975976 RepID=UPI002E2476C1